MRLSDYTDYTLRVLMYCATHRDRLVTIGELAEQHGLSKNHLMKVVNDLVRAGYLESVRGRSGGIRLARAAAQINVGGVIRHTEGGFDLVDCGSCVIAPACGLTGALHEALAAFMAVLDGYTLEGLLARKMDLRALLAPEVGPN